MRFFGLALAAALACMSSAASAQCSGVFASGRLCGNSGASNGVAASTTISALFDRVYGARQVNVKDYGATCNGVADDTAALQAAAASGRPLYFPPGVCRTTAKLVMATCTVWHGDGPWDVEIRSSATNQPVVEFAGAAGGRGCTLRGMQLTHTGVTPVAGGDGVYAKYLGNYHVIDDVLAFENYVGFNLGPVSMAWIKNSVASFNISHGFSVSDSLGGVNFGPFQWQFLNNLAEANGGDGFRWQVVNQAAAVGQIDGVQTYLNSGVGLRFLGLNASEMLSAIRVSNAFLGNDNGAGEIYLDTFYDGVAQFTNVYIENAGSAGTGPTPHPALNTSASGIFVTVNNGFVEFDSLTVLGSQSHGFYGHANHTVISNAVFSGNGIAGGSGIVSDIAGDKVHLSNVWTGNYTGSSQAFGLFGADGNDWSWVNVTGTGNSSALTGFSANAISGVNATSEAVQAGAATVASVNKVTITPPAAGATLTIPNGVTLTGPAASGTAMTLGNTETVTGVKTFGSAGAVGRLKIAGTTSGAITLDASAVAGAGTLTLPAATDTLVGKATTDILTNKTFNTAGAGNVFQIAGNGITGVSGSGATVLLSQSPAILAPQIAGSSSGATAINAAAAASGAWALPAATDTFVGRATTDTLTNKTLTTPTIATINNTGGVSVQGTNTNNNAAAGYVGEIISSTVDSGSAVSLTSTVPITITSVSLTAGDWDVTGMIHFSGNTTTTVSYILSSISEVNNTRDASTAGSYVQVTPQSPTTPYNVLAFMSAPIGPMRKSFASTTTVYLVAQSQFAVSTSAAYGVIRARRVR